jgi:hypothetical protein
MPASNRAVATALTDSCGFKPRALEGGALHRVPRRTLSAETWGFDLYEGLPRTLSSDGVQAVRGDLSRVRDFLKSEYPTLTQEGLGVAPNPMMAAAKRRYLDAACEVIELRLGGKTIGVFVGAPEDWSTYYVRTFAIDRGFQRRALLRRFVSQCLFDVLSAHHVERIVADTSPANLAMARMFSELQFYVTGHQLSDRWGPMVRYTKFLDPTSEAAFNQRFSGTAPSVG